MDYNFADIQRDTIELIKDSSPTIIASVPQYINEAVQQIADRVKPPELRQVSSVTTNPSSYYVNMPTTFSSRLSYVGDSDGEYQMLDGGLEELIRLHPTLAEVGDIEDVVQEGNLLYYQPSPAVGVALTLLGYHSPADLSGATDTPSFIPWWLRRETIVNKAVSIAYTHIEDGTEGDPVNVKLFSDLAEIGILKLFAYISKRRPIVSTPAWSV